MAQENQKHDEIYKKLLSHYEIFLQLLGFLKEKWVGHLDVNSLQKMNNSFILPDYSKKEADLIYRVKTKDGKNDIFLYILMELQYSVDFFIPYRLLVYMVGVWQEHLKHFKEEETGRKGFRLPPVIPIVLSNSPDRWTAAVNFREILDGQELFGKYVPDFQYFVIDINRCDREKLEEMGNLISKIFILEQNRKTPDQVMKTMVKMTPDFERLSKEQLKIFLEWFEEAVVKKLSSEQQAKITADIKDVLADRMGVEFMISNVSRTIEESLKASKLEGRLEGELKGRLEGKLEAAENMLNEGMDEELITRILGLDIEEIQNLKNQRMN